MPVWWAPFCRVCAGFWAGDVQVAVVAALCSAAASGGAKRKAAAEGEGADRCGSKPCAVRSSQAVCRMVTLTVVELKSSTAAFTVS